MENKKQTPQQRYRKKNVKRFYLECIMSTEQDIISKLESVDKYNTYIKRLIREDIERSKSSDK